MKACKLAILSLFSLLVSKVSAEEESIMSLA